MIVLVCGEGMMMTEVAGSFSYPLVASFIHGCFREL